MSTNFAHGHSGYINHGCRCSTCTGAHSVYQREWREANHARYAGQHPEGKPYNASTYKNHGCRCFGCTEAKRAYHRDYYERRKAEAEK